MGAIVRIFTSIQVGGCAGSSWELAWPGCRPLFRVLLPGWLGPPQGRGRGCLIALPEGRQSPLLQAWHPTHPLCQQAGRRLGQGEQTCWLERPFAFPPQETGDALMALTYVITATCNGILVGQLFYYRDVPLARRKQE